MSETTALQQAERALQDTIWELDLETMPLLRIQQSLFQLALLLVEDEQNAVTDGQSVGFLLQILSEDLANRINRIKEIIKE
ncbi:MAG: hypothetical protein KGV56_01815 [Gammaproteobacteria bacterium]|nr:hypothetical protein [Gammaproteobacteria bacterium]